MKKLVFTMVIALAVTTAVSAQSYIVQEVTGRVERDAGSGRWVPVSAGETLRADTVIRTVIGASLTVRNGEQVSTIGAMKNGRLIDLTGSSPAVQIQGRVSQTDTSEINRSTGRVSTASARASDAATEIEIEE
jgi:hypothetical protein